MTLLHTLLRQCCAAYAHTLTQLIPCFLHTLPSTPHTPFVSHLVGVTYLFLGLGLATLTDFDSGKPAGNCYFLVTMRFGTLLQATTLLSNRNSTPNCHCKSRNTCITIGKVHHYYWTPKHGGIAMSSAPSLRLEGQGTIYIQK